VEIFGEGCSVFEKIVLNGVGLTLPLSCLVNDHSKLWLGDAFTMGRSFWGFGVSKRKLLDDRNEKKVKSCLKRLNFLPLDFHPIRYIDERYKTTLICLA